MDASCLDAVARALAGTTPRRRLVAAALALGLGTFVPRLESRARTARSVNCPSGSCPTGQCYTCIITQEDNVTFCGCKCQACPSSGIAGGGAVQAESSEAHLALFATRTAIPDQSSAFVILGQVRWTDPAWEGVGLTLESTAVIDYALLVGVDGGRAASGWMRTDQRPGDYPFVIRAVDAGPPRSGQDAVALWVGDAALDDPAFDDPAFADLAVPEAEPSGFRYTASGTLTSGDLQLLSLGDTSGTAATPAP